MLGVDFIFLVNSCPLFFWPPFLIKPLLLMCTVIMGCHYKEKLGSRLRKLRIQNGISQESLADMIGVNQSTIARIESGRANIQLQHLPLICRCFGIGIPDFLEINAEDKK